MEKQEQKNNKKLNFVLDVDGVLTTGQFLYDSKGKAYKIFGAHDSDGLKLLKNKLNIYFITADARGYSISKKRIEDMGFAVELVTEKDRYEHFRKRFGFKNSIFMGDGIFDAKIIRDCLFGIAPKNARIEAKQWARYVTPSKSGEGAVCDACIKINKVFFGGKI
jgi:3-deoxy-D-manno-octulosonate 8-phosphate phosphatase (KDO 8-P phosphatase)